MHLHIKYIYIHKIFFNLCFHTSFQVAKEIPVFNVKVWAHLDYLAPRVLKEIEVSEQWLHSNEVSMVSVCGVIAQKTLG